MDELSFYQKDDDFWLRIFRFIRPEIFIFHTLKARRAYRSRVNNRSWFFEVTIERSLWFNNVESLLSESKRSRRDRTQVIRRRSREKF